MSEDGAARSTGAVPSASVASAPPPEPLRIVYSSPLDPTRHASAGAHVASVASEWAQAGHDVTLVHPGDELGLSGVRDVSVSSSDGGRMARDVLLASAVARALGEHRADLLYHRFSKSSVLPLLSARWRGVPVVSEVNADVFGEAEDWGHRWLTTRAVLVLEKLNYALSHHLVVVSNGVRAALEKRHSLPNGKMSVIPNGTDVSLFRPRSRSACRASLGLDEARSYVVYTGSFQERQGLGVLLEATALLRARHPDLRILLVGDGPTRASLEAGVSRLLLGDVVRFCGWRPAEEAAQFLGAADVCVAPFGPTSVIAGEDPTRYGALMTGSPLKVLSYMAAARPTVASHFSEAGGLLESASAGVAVKPNSAAALAEALGRLLDDSELRERMGRQARRVAVEDHTWKSVALRLGSLCRRVTDEARSRRRGGPPGHR